MITIPVDLGARGYEVLVGEGARHELSELVSRAVPGTPRRAAIVTQEAIMETGWFGELDPGLAFDVFVVGEGERAKTVDAAGELCRTFIRSGLKRNDVIVAVGGGLVSDLAGFAAAVYLRGVPYINVATSLLAQVDAAIGGKTAVNLPEGRNLVGSFWQPRAVVCDPQTLASLPVSEMRSGRGEMAKYAFLDGAGPDVTLLELDLTEQVARCVALKAEIVAEDEHESGRRALLNYGHTLAHALEAALLASDWGGEGHPISTRDLRHGDAVAIGLVFAALLARRLGRIDDERVQLHRRIVEGFGLPAALPGGIDRSQLIEYMARDKKAHHELTFVLDGPRGVEVVRGVEASDVLATLAEMEAGT